MLRELFHLMFGYLDQGQHLSEAEPLEFSLSVSTEDEAVEAVGFLDAMVAQGVSDLREFERTLSREIEAKTKALGAVREAIDRTLNAVAYDPADDAKKSYDLAVEVKRERGDTTWPVRASEESKPTKPKRRSGKPLAAVEA